MLSLKTTSLRKRTADWAINNLVEEQPEYSTIAKYLCEFQGQIWAREVRKSAKLDTVSLLEAIKENGEYFGIRNVGFNPLEYQKTTLEATDEIIDFFDDALHQEYYDSIEKELIDELFYRKVSGISERKLTPKIEPMFKKIFENNYREFDALLSGTKAITSDLEEDIEVVYHDIEILFKLSSLFRDFTQKTPEINKKDVYYYMLQAIDQLKNFPFEKDVKTVMRKRFDNDNFSTVCKSMRKHHDYVEKRYYIGLDALRWIFWGYTSLE